MSDEGNVSPHDVWAPPTSETAVWATPESGDHATHVPTKRGGRWRNALVASAAAVVVAGAVVGVLVGGGSSSPRNPLAGESAAQILQQSLTAGRHAGSFRILANGPATGLRVTMTLDVGPGGGSATGTDGNGQVRLVMTPDNTYLEADTAYWTSNGLPASAAAKYADRWVSLGPASLFGGSAKGETANSFLSEYVALTGQLAVSPSGAGAGTVTVTGKLPGSSQNGGGQPATLTISTSAPYYPVSITFDDPSVGQSRFAFSNWGESVVLSIPKDAVPIEPSTPASGSIAAEADLQTALTGAKVYYTEGNQTYNGLNPATFAPIDTGLTAVPSTTASIDEKHVSLLGRGDIVVIAAWSPSSSTCLAIVDNTGSTTAAGTRGPGTDYLETSRIGQAGCDAAAFAGATLPAGTTRSLDGFPQG